MHPIFVLLFVVLIIIIAILIHRVIKQGGTFSDDDWYEGYTDSEFEDDDSDDDYEASGVDVTIFNVKNELLKMLKENVEIYRDNGLNNYNPADPFDDYYEDDIVIKRLQLKSEPEYPYLILLLQTYVRISKAIDDEFYRPFLRLRELMDEAIDHNYRGHNISYIKSIRWNSDSEITKEVYDELKENVRDWRGSILLRRMRDYVESARDSKWSEMLDECVAAKPAPSSGRKTKAALRRNLDDDEDDVAEYKAPDV